MGPWLFIGLLIGAVVVFLLMQQRVSQQNKDLKHNRMRLEQIEREHPNRIRNATLQLKEDYGRQLAEQKLNFERQLAEQAARSQAESDQRAAALEQAYAARIQSLEQALGSSTQEASKGVEPMPSNLSALPETPFPSAQSAAPTASKSSTSPKSVPPIPATLSTPGQDRKLSSSGVAAALTQSGSVPPQGEAPLATLTADSQQIDPSTRKQVAITLGQFVAGNKRATAQRSLPILSKLIQDPDPSVRQAAVHALGGMSSVKVIPLLKRALRDTDNDVVQTASTALRKFKGASAKTTQPKTRKKLPKNR